jgi:copper chaperone NosL
MIANKFCDTAKINLKEFKSVAELKGHLASSDVCHKKLNDMQLQAISVYLYDNKEKLNFTNHIEVPHDAKCPVCGMFVAKYPKWAASLKDTRQKYFDGVKDMMKYIFASKNRLSDITVSDYYTTNAIDAKSAFYVVGSNVYGPMGNELIPFLSLDSAKVFIKNHGGKVLQYDQIDTKVIKSLDE